MLLHVTHIAVPSPNRARSGCSLSSSRCRASSLAWHVCNGWWRWHRQCVGWSSQEAPDPGKLQGGGGGVGHHPSACASACESISLCLLPLHPSLPPPRPADALPCAHTPAHPSPSPSASSTLHRSKGTQPLCPRWLSVLAVGCWLSLPVTHTRQGRVVAAALGPQIPCTCAQSRMLKRAPRPAKRPPKRCACTGRVAAADAVARQALAQVGTQLQTADPRSLFG